MPGYYDANFALVVQKAKHTPQQLHYGLSNGALAGTVVDAKGQLASAARLLLRR